MFVCHSLEATLRPEIRCNMEHKMTFKNWPFVIQTLQLWSVPWKHEGQIKGYNQGEQAA